MYFWRATALDDSLFRVQIDRTPEVVVRAPELVTAMKNDDIATAATRNARYLIHENWFGELRRRTAAKPH